ncbi:MAG TPA: carboxypeptidase-like regulatory domain-containing protein [Acidobacteriaceae bacterium]
MRRSGGGSRRGAGARMVWCAAALAVLTALLPAADAQNFGLKNVQGKVLDGKDAPINGAIVYLENKRNSDIKTFISTSTGSYRFADLAADTDYSLWAAYHGKKSGQKTISSFDTRKQIDVDLKIK